MIRGQRSVVLDGLRGIAILWVVLYHLYPQIFPGGFIGVDIFFVLSGYLITQSAVRATNKNEFSIRSFYKKRILRIVPALLIVLIFVVFGGYFLLLDVEYKPLLTHVAVASVFFTNIKLISESGYFDSASEMKPLLHLWSLSIEEQFYLLFPFLFLWMRSKRQLYRVFFFGSVVAFFLNIIFIFGLFGINSNLNVAFFSPFSRFFELGIGVVLGIFNPVARLSHIPSSFLTGFSLIGFLVSLFLFDGKYRYPGFWSLIPVVSSVLAILSANGVGRISIYESKLLRFFGRISFSWYLWHWVLLSFAHIIEGASANFYFCTVIGAISLIIAYGSTRFIEEPIIKSRHSVHLSRFLLMALFSLGLGAWIGPKIFDVSQREFKVIVSQVSGDIGHEAFYRFLQERAKTCKNSLWLKKPLFYGNLVRCWQSGDFDIPQMVVIGDSHAEHLFPGLVERFPGKNILAYIQDESPNIRSQKFRDQFLYIADSPGIKEVVIAAHWIARHWTKEDLADLSKLLRGAGKSVYFVLDNPKFLFVPEKCKFQRIFRTQSGCTQDKKSYIKDLFPMSSFFGIEANLYFGVHVLSPLATFCDANQCSMAPDGTLYYRDPNHLNVAGSIKLIQNLFP